MKYILFGSFLLFISCQTSPSLHEGRWTGTLTPMNHPDMTTPLVYDVSYIKGDVLIDIIGPDSTRIPVRNIRVESDTLRFEFNEPEEQVVLTCALGREDAGGFSGRCIDVSGKWAQFTMKPPVEINL